MKGDDSYHQETLLMRGLLFFALETSCVMKEGGINMFWYLLSYFIIGLISIVINSCIVVIKLGKKGYFTKDIIESIDDFKSENGISDTNYILRAILGFIIWPIRLIQLYTTYKTILQYLNKKEEQES